MTWELMPPSQAPQAIFQKATRGQFQTLTMLLQSGSRIALNLLGQCIDSIERHPQGFTDIPHCTSSTIGNDCCSQPRSLAAIFLVKVLSTSSRRSCSKSISISGFIPFAADNRSNRTSVVSGSTAVTPKQKQRLNLRQNHVPDKGYDAAWQTSPDPIPSENSLQIHLLDQPEFARPVPDFPDLIPVSVAFPAISANTAWGLACRCQLFGILITQLVKIEDTSICNLQSAFESLWELSEGCLPLRQLLNGAQHFASDVRLPDPRLFRA